MSYDIYCYKSPSNSLNTDEVDSIIESDQNRYVFSDKVPSYKERAIALLKAYNPRLTSSQITSQSEREDRKIIRHVELNPAVGDPIIQVTVYDNHVFFSIPYWYEGAEAEKLMGILKGYIRVLREELGFFVYDPQTGEVYDPAENDYDGLEKYLEVGNHLEDIIGENKEQSKNKKPWWKFW